MGIDITIHPCYTTDMLPHPELLLPDDEYYYFGVELPWSPEEVQGRLLRKPEFLYSVTTDDEEVDEEYRTSWLYLWRCNEGWDMRIGHLPARERIAQMHARHNMSLHVVLHALTEDEALNPSTYSERQPARYILLEPSSAEGCQTIGSCKSSPPGKGIPPCPSARVAGTTSCRRIVSAASTGTSTTAPSAGDSGEASRHGTSVPK